MSLILVEGGEGFAATGQAIAQGVLSRKYPFNAGFDDLVQAAAGRWPGSQSLYLTSTSCKLGRGSLTTNSTIVVGFAYKLTGSVSTDRQILRLLDGETSGMSLWLLSGSGISVRRGSTIVASTPAPSFLVGPWYYFEFKVICADSGGSVEVRLNGETVLQWTGDTKVGTNSYHDGVLFPVVYTGAACYLDDIYILDGAGTLNTFLGSKGVLTLFPSANSSVQWTPSSGNNFECVDDSATDDDTSYVSSSTVGHLDLYAFPAITALAGGVAGVQINANARVESEGGTDSLYLPAKFGSIQSDGSLSGLLTTYATCWRVMESDPDGDPWTISTIDDTDFGVLLG